MKIGPAIAVIATLLVAACSADPATPVRYYRVEVAPAPAAGDFSGRIVVEPFEVYGIYTERPLVFRSGDSAGVLEQYNYQFWAEPPAIMLRDSLVTHLRSAFKSAQVLQAGGRARGDLTVRPRLKRLDHVLGRREAAFAVEFRVTDADDNERLLLSFDETVAAGGSSIEDYVAATDRLAAKAYAALVERIRALPPAATPGRSRAWRRARAATSAPPIRCACTPAAAQRPGQLAQRLLAGAEHDVVDLEQRRASRASRRS